MRATKLIALLVLSTCLQVSAGVSSQPITFSGKNVSLEKVFNAIYKQSGYLVFCDYSLIKDAKKVNIHVRDASVQTVLNECLKDQPLSYEIVDKTIIIERKKVTPAAEAAPAPPPIDVHGRITNDKGEPVPAATVVVKGTSKVTATNDNGEFTLTGVDDHAVLVITSIGYERTEIGIAGQASLSIHLKVAAAAINEIVVTALGITKEERKLGYAVTTVGGEQLNKARETNVALSLGGQVAGLTVHGANGGPGSSARILLRGMPSMNSGGSPLFIINGVPIDNSQRGSSGEWGGSDNGDGISNINPDDIESLTVLKGQAASALYGARASNGVIIITTKSAKKGQPLLEYNGNAQWDKAANYTDFQYQYGQGIEGVKPTTAAGALSSNRFAWGSKLDGLSTIQYNGQSYAYSPFKDNIKNFYQTGPTWTNTVSVGQANDRGSFRLSASTLNNTSIVRNSGIDRRTINLNVTQKITDKLTATIFGNYIDEQDRNRPQLSDGPGNPNNFQFLAPNVDERIFQPGQDAKGNEIVFSDDNYVTNPWFVVNNWINSTGRQRLIGAASLKYNFTDWLYVMGRAGIDKEDDRIFNVTPTGTNYSFNNAGESGQFNGLTTQSTKEINWDLLAGVSHKLTDDLHLDATLGGNIRTNNYEYVQINGSQFIIPFLYTPSNVLSFGRNYAVYNKEIHSGFYSIDLNYKDWLLLTTTGRYDAFSTLPKSNRGIFTPSVSGGFVFSHFLENTSLNFGKIRAAYAQTSGEPIGGPNNTNSGAYQTNVYYGVGNAFNGTPVGTLNGVGNVENDNPSLPNLFLKPFTLTEVEVGTELKFYNNRLGIDADYFTRKTKNEIQQASLSQATGYTSTYVGTGSTQNNGFELQITGTPVKMRDFTWNISFNYTHVTNKILQTDADGKRLTLGTYRPLNANTAFIKGMPGPQIIAYDYTYDTKGNIIVDGSGLPVRAATLTPFGGVLPTDYGGLRNDFTFGNINFGFLIDYNYGNKILSATNYYTLYRGLNQLTLAGRGDNGITTGVTASGAQNTKAATAQDYYQRIATISRNNVLSGDYIKLRQVTLGYTFSGKTLGNIPVFEAIQVSLVGRNLLYISKKSPNIDPESNFASSVRYAGIEGTSLPSTRTFGINVNFKFKK